MKSPVIAAGIILLVSASAYAAPTVLSSCGETVEDAVLGADLDCSGVPGYAVTIARGGRLDLAGHRLVSGATDPSLMSVGGGVLCEADCSVVGGGGALVSSVAQDSDEWVDGVIVRYKNRGRVSISGTSIVGYKTGAMATDLTIDSSVLTDNYLGCSAIRNLSIRNSDITSGALYAQAASGRNVFIADSTLVDGGGGVRGKKINLYRVTISGMHGDGVEGHRIYAEDSVIDGNCTDIPDFPDCGDVCSDGRKAPKLVNTTCSTSVRYLLQRELRIPWGVCSLD